LNAYIGKMTHIFGSQLMISHSEGHPVGHLSPVLAICY